MHEWTNKQRGLSHDPTASPIPGQHSLCSSITQQTHAYSRADRSAVAQATCRAVKIQKEHVNRVSNAWKRTQLPQDCIIIANSNSEKEPPMLLSRQGWLFFYMWLSESDSADLLSKLQHSKSMKTEGVL